MKRLRVRGRRSAPDGPKLFCRLPFTEVAVLEGGEVYPNCCADWVDFSLGNLRTQSWDDVWNGKRARALRRSMLDGDLRHCDPHWCPHIQNARRGIPDHNVVPHDSRHELALPPEARDGKVRLSTGPTNVGMHHDDSCNLACPTCRDRVHMARGEEYDRVAEVQEVLERDILPGAEIISLTGTGDPFASKFLRDFLLGFDPAAHPSLRTVHLHTNAILWTSRLWSRMRGLHQIDVTTDISIDAARRETYEMVRTPARWDTLMANLDFIVGIPNLRTLGLSMTVSRLNVGELVEFHDLARDVLSRCPEKFGFIEYKRVRRRLHHDDRSWSDLALEELDAADATSLVDQLRHLDGLRASGDGPDIRSNLSDFLELVPA